MKAFVTLIEIVAGAPGGGAGLTIRAATTHAIGIRAGERRDFAAFLSDHPTFEWGIFAAGRLDGPTVSDFGSATLSNEGERFDALTDLVGGVWTVTAWQMELPSGGDVVDAGNLDAIDPAFTGSCGVPSVSTSAIEIPLRSPLRGFDRALEEDTFDGTNAGLAGDEGEAALEGQVRPTTLGYCMHVPAPASNEAAARHEVNNGTVEAIAAAYANGEAAAHTADVVAGRYTYTANVTQLTRTADVRGNKPDGIYRSTAGDLIARLATARAGIAGIEAADLAAVNAARPEEVGFFAGGRATVRNAADFLARGGEIYYLVDPVGALRLGTLTPPAGPAAVTLLPAHLRQVSQGTDLEVLRIAPHRSIEERDPASLGDDGGLPVWRVVVRGMRHWVGALDEQRIAQGLGEDARAELRQEWREAVAENPAVKAAFPDAAEITVETGHTTRAAMQATADRVLAIRECPQQLVRVRVSDRYLPDWFIGDTVSLTHPRYGLSGGALFRAMRRVKFGGHSTLDLWRPVVTA